MAAASSRKAMILSMVKKRKITEDDPRWNPGLMGNKKWGKKYRGAANYSKGGGRPD